MSEHHWRKRFKEEMDGVWFQELSFDEKLKDRIREQIRAEESANGLKIRSAETDAGKDGMQRAEQAPRRWMAAGAMRRRMVGAAIAASLLVASVVTFSGTLTGDAGDPYIATIENGTLQTTTDSALPEAAEIYDVFGSDLEGSVDADPLSSGGEVIDVLQAGPDGDGAIGMEAHDVTTSVVELGDLAEARRMFGEDLLLPGYLPEGYELERIYLTGLGEDEAAAQGLELRYTSSAGSFKLVQQRTAPDTSSADSLASGEHVEWEGMSGLLIVADSGLELRWKSGSLDVLLSGSLDRDELLRIAASVS